MTATQETLAANLRQRRAALGLGYRALSERSGVAASCAWGAEHGHMPVVRSLERLAEALGCTLAELLAEPSCPFCRDAAPPGYFCGTCGQGDRPAAAVTPVPAGLLGDLAALVESGDIEALTDEHGVLRFAPSAAADCTPGGAS